METTKSNLEKENCHSNAMSESGFNFEAETNESNQLAATPDVKVNPVCLMELLSSALDFSASEEADEFARGEDGDSEVGGEETKPRKNCENKFL